MNRKEIIKQLKNLKSHCEDFVDREEEDDVWAKDIEALEYAIKMLEESNLKPIETTLGTLYYEISEERFKLYDTDKQYIGFIMEWHLDSKDLTKAIIGLVVSIAVVFVLNNHHKIIEVLMHYISLH